jgi:small subunit ribosomal protein S11
MLKQPKMFTDKMSKTQTIKLTVNCTSRNTILQATAPNCTITVSTGLLGFVGAKRSSPHAAQQTAEFMAEKLVEHRFMNIMLIFKGFNKGRKSVIKGLKKQQINILKLVDKSTVAHNGCRLPKKRRL